MDPLFGYVDDVADVQHQQEQQVVGSSVGFTISFPSIVSTTAAGHTNSYPHHLQAPSVQQICFPGTATPGISQAQPVVRVVAGKSDKDQQIYVIKLENLLQENSDLDLGSEQLYLNGEDCGLPNQGEGIPVVEGETANMGANDSASDNDEGNEKPKDGEEEESDPFLVVSPESVMAMAQSVGVELNEDDASELGCIAINKLRHALLIALQFSQNENSEGLTTQQFSKAEKQLGSEGYGHRTVFRETSFKYAGNVSILDDGPEMDLHATISKNSEDPKEVPIDGYEPALHVHYLQTYDSASQIGNNSSNFNLYNEPVAKVVSGNNDKGTSNPNQSQQINSGGKIDYEDVLLLTDREKIPLELLNKVISEVKSAGEMQQPNDSQNQLNSSKSDGKKQLISSEWSSYLQVLLDQVSCHNNFKKMYYNPSGFMRILYDIRHNGAHPIFRNVCDSFRDCLRNPNLSVSEITNILAVVDALVSSECQPTLAQMADLGSVLIEVIILPPPCEVHHLLTNIFMKILKTCNELLTWTCTYVTEMLKGTCDTSTDKFTDSLKCTVNGALCLANGLEELKIQVAQEFGWHISVLNLSKNHSTVLGGNGQTNSMTETKQDSYLEEEILKFYHNFVNNYTALVLPSELSRVRETVIGLYGERFLSFLPSSGMPSDKQTFSNAITNLQYPKTQNVYKKVVYKNRELIVPCRKVLK